MATTDAQKRASAKYAKEKVRTLNLRFAPPDYELYDWLKAQDNMSGYLKRLIREDMERQAREG